MSASDDSLLAGIIVVGLVAGTLVPFAAFGTLIPRAISRLNMAWLLVTVPTLGSVLIRLVSMELVGLEHAFANQDPAVAVLDALATPACPLIVGGSLGATFLLVQALWLFLAVVGHELVAVAAEAARTIWRRTRPPLREV